MKIAEPLPEQISQLRTLWKDAFGDGDDFLDDFFSAAYSQHRSRCVTVQDKAVAMLYWFDCEYEGRKIAYIYAVATDKSFRGQGICNKLMRDTHRHLKSLGYAGSILVPGSESLFRFYEGMGYKPCCYGRRFTCAAEDSGIALGKIYKEEFARLRRSLLPENSVIQEKENLSFLETQAEFYKGESLLMCAFAEDGILTCLEYLGNEDMASGAVSALGCREGCFFAPGKELPFAMYLPFDEATSYPTYFGFAFN